MKLTLWYIGLLIRTRPYIFVGLWLFMLWLFVYLTSLDLFGAIWTNDALGFFDKISFMIDSVRNVLTNLSDPRALSIFVFSFVSTINLLLMWQTYRRRQQAKSNKLAAAGSIGALIGSHCIACGGSFIAPLITTLAGSSAFFSAERVNTAITISVAINIVAIIVVGWATLKLAKQEMKFTLEGQHV